MRRLRFSLRLGLGLGLRLRPGPTLATFAALGAFVALATSTSTSTSDAAPRPAPCPISITAAATKAVANTTVTSCTPEREDGIDKFEVKLARADNSTVDVDVSTDGKILAIEEPIPLDQLPAPVTNAFATRYPRTKPTAASRELVTDKGTFYELTFTAAGKTREATFQPDGTFVDEE
jgi:hypothetical protein